MGEKNSTAAGPLWRKSFFYLFVTISILFMVSLYFVLPNSKLFPATSDAHIPPQHQNCKCKCKEEGENVHTFLQEPPSILKVFMYDLPSEFHFGLLNWKPRNEEDVWPKDIIPAYPGGLNLQHSVEYWLTLDLLRPHTDPAMARSVVRVYNSSEADIIFVPFFSSLSYNRYSKVKPGEKESNNILLQKKLVQILTGKEEWKRSGGRDHVILAHHPNSMMNARSKLWPAIFILSDFGRYPPNIANVEKDVIAPYKHMVETYANDLSGFDSRPILLFFQGAIYRKDGGFIRQELYYLLKEEKDVHFSMGSADRKGVQTATEGMRSSKFCLNIAGDTPSSNRLFDAIASHCVPVIISDDIELPYEDVLDYSTFCLFARTSDSLRPGFLLDLLRRLPPHHWAHMHHTLIRVHTRFQFHHPSLPGDAVHMIWNTLARKLPNIRINIHRSRRLSPSPNQTLLPPSASLPKNFSLLY